MKLYRFENYQLKENETKGLDAIVNSNKVRETVFVGEEGLYNLLWFPDTNTFKLIFPDKAYLIYDVKILNIEEENPFAEYEKGNLLSWMRHAIYSMEYEYRLVVDDYVLENSTNHNAITMQRYYYVSDDGFVVPFDISTSGMVVVTIPERRVAGSPDDLANSPLLGEFSTLFNGELMDAVRQKFGEITGKEF